VKRAAFLCALLFMSRAFAAEGGADNVADTAADPNAPTVAASISRTDAHVGDRLTLTLNAVAKKGYAVSLPAAVDLGKFELEERTEGDHEGRDLGNGRRSFQFVLTITAFELGQLQVPAIRLTYLNPKGETHEVSTAPIDVRILSLITEGEKAELQKERPPRAVWIEDRRVVTALKWAGGILAGLLVLAMLVRAARRMRGRSIAIEAEALAVRRPPEEVALERLREIRDAGNFEQQGYRPFSFAVAEVVRAFLGGLYGFDSLEMTTTELIAELQTRMPQLIAPGGQLEVFLQDTDLIKFAKTGATPEQALALIDTAQAIVLSAPKPAPPEPVIAQATSDVA
jgi:hypothetical protein